MRRYFVLLDTDDREAAAAMERYDAAFRRLCVERGALAEAQLPFFAGPAPRATCPATGLAAGRGHGAAGALTARPPCGGDARPGSAPR